MEKKDNKKVMVFITSIAVIIVIVIIALVVAKGNKEPKGNEQDTNITNTKLEKLEGYTKKCTIEELSEGYHLYTVVNMKISGDRLISSQNTMKLTFDNKDDYNREKENLEVGEDVIFDEDNLTIEYISGDVTDFTKSISGGDSYENYKNYKASLEELGYSCE